MILFNIFSILCYGVNRFLTNSNSNENKQLNLFYLQLKMSDQFLGCTVSVKCIDDVAYQGKIIDLNKNSLTLAKTFCNGIPHSSSIVILR